MRFCFWSLSFFFSCFLCAEIRECSSIRDLLEEQQSGTLFIFDIDNTLMHPCQMLGSDEWVDYYWEKKASEGLVGAELRKSVIEPWAVIQVLTKMKLIENEAPSIIDQLQGRPCSVIGLTSRSESVSRATRLQLQSLAIDMSKASITEKNFCLEEFPSAYFLGGILFSGGQDKKTVLMSFFKQIHFTPERIVFIDDKRSNLVGMEKVEEMGIRFVGLRYDRADPLVKAFDPHIAEIQLEHLQGSLLSDEKAQELVQISKSSTRH